MTRGTKEFEAMRDGFELAFRRLPGSRGRLDRCKEADGSAINFYEDGQTNAMFHAYMAGYSHARFVAADH